MYKHRGAADKVVEQIAYLDLLNFTFIRYPVTQNIFDNKKLINRKAVSWSIRYSLQVK